jgi:hypothetical protein
MQCPNNGVFTPTNNDPILCDGVFTSTECALTPEALTFLNVPINGSQDLINKKLILVIQDLLARIVVLENA